MKKFDFKVITILVLLLVIFGLLIRKPEIREVEKIVEIEKEIIVKDTIEIEVPFEVETIKEVPYQVIKEIEKTITIRDTIQVEKIVEVPIEKIKEVERIVEVERPKTNDWYLGMGYDFGANPFFTGAGTRILYKTKSDIMFGGEVGVRNNIMDFETMEGKLKPYVGGVIYIKIKSKE